MKGLAAVAGITLLTVYLPSKVIGADQHDRNEWTGTWACSPQLLDSSVSPPTPDVSDTTLRQIVRVSIGGATIRIRFSNEFGKTPLTITAAHIAKVSTAGAIQPGTDKALAFGEQLSVTIPAGALAYSNPVGFDLAPLSDLAISLHLKHQPDGLTTHAGSRATSYFTQGDATSELTLPAALAIDHWYFLTGVDVLATKSSAAVAILGDSITDGRGSTTNGNGRWPDRLASRFQSNKHTRNIGVLNEGIGGNRLLHDGLGPNALARFDRDILAQSNVRWLVILEGVNDIGTCRTDCNLDALTRDLILAYRQLVTRAHSHHVKVYGATILPFAGSGYSSPSAEHARQAVNGWIRTKGSFDAVIDLDAATRDPQNTLNLVPKADSGDHLHPNDVGYQMMADSINLKLFSK